MTLDIPKYALLEIERKMRVDAALLPSLSDLPFRLITDRYLDGSRLRLRKIVSNDEVPQYKLCKKYGQVDLFAEPITNLYLTEAEYNTLIVLPGRDLVKRRYRYPFGRGIFSLDEFGGSHTGLYLCEIEASSVTELAAIAFPPFCIEDVSANPLYTGVALASR